MSRYYPHTPYAEDQPFSHAIVATHVLARAATIGAVMGSGFFGVRELVNRSPKMPKVFGGGGGGGAAAAAAGTAAKPATATATAGGAVSAAAAAKPRAVMFRRFLGTTGTGTMWAMGLLAVVLAARMNGREAIEWKDRAWRLMENRGQLATDDWTAAGAAAGLIAAAVLAGGPASLGWRAALGAAGSGTVVGVIGYTASRGLGIKSS